MRPEYNDVQKQTTRRFNSTPRAHSSSLGRADTSYPARPPGPGALGSVGSPCGTKSCCICACVVKRGKTGEVGAAWLPTEKGSSPGLGTWVAPPDCVGQPQAFGCSLKTPLVGQPCRHQDGPFGHVARAMTAERCGSARMRCSCSARSACACGSVATCARAGQVASAARCTARGGRGRV